MEVTLLGLVFISALFLQIFFQLMVVIGMLRASSSKELPPDLVLPPLSIVVVARNESGNLPICIPKLLSLEYPEYELVLVNDRSTDNSLEVMRAFEEKDHRIKLVNIDSERYNSQVAPGKKFALTLGIEAAKHDSIVLTDADCIPHDNWLREMGKGFAQGGSLFIGTGNYSSQGLVGSLHAVVNFRFSQLYLTACEFGMPFGAVGRSMGMSREAFYRVQGFEEHMSIPSGSDDLLVQSFFGNSVIRNVPRACTESKSPESLSSWMRQRSRHVKASFRYRWSHKILLGIYEFSNLLSLISLFYIIFSWNRVGLIIMAMFALRSLLVGIGKYRARKLFSHTEPFVKLLLLEYPAAILNSLFSSIGLVSKPAEWRREK